MFAIHLDNLVHPLSLLTLSLLYYKINLQLFILIIIGENQYEHRQQSLTTYIMD